MAAYKQGGMVIIVDDEDRKTKATSLCRRSYALQTRSISWQNSAEDLFVPPWKANGSMRLGIPMMVCDNTSRFETAFTDSVDAAKGHDDGNLCSRPGIDGPRNLLTLKASRLISCGRATCFPSGLVRAACSCVAARQRRRSTWRGWPDCFPQASSARS